MLTLLGGIISHSVFSSEKTQPCDNPIFVVIILMNRVCVPIRK